MKWSRTTDTMVTLSRQQYFLVEDTQAEPALRSTHNRPTAKMPRMAIFCEWRRLSFQINGVGTTINDMSVRMFGIEFPRKNWCRLTPQLYSDGSGGLTSNLSQNALIG